MGHELDADGTSPGIDGAFLRVYDELRRLAQQRLSAGMGGRSLQATALVHEVWLRLSAGQPGAVEVRDPAHFYASAAQAMRWILLDHARRKRAAKRDGEGRLERTQSGAEPDAAAEKAEEVLALDRALEKLREQDPRKAEVVLLRHYAGLSIEDAAKSLGLSPATVKREWQFARAWLLREVAR